MRPITTAVDAATDEAISRLAAGRGITRDEFAADALRRAVQADEELAAFVQVGIDAADRGDLIPQDVVFAELRERRHRLRSE
ncbi:CopG family ribbon-helix-helix protein [Sphingomonas sp. SAFR-052]|uniref:CopG family ribbon-helix-helix protein n=1 Tax=Sphingomonas sp. SAFR-052 TaxID=3436867 RepID=UPI003F7DE332